MTGNNIGISSTDQIFAVYGQIRPIKEIDKISIFDEC